MVAMPRIEAATLAEHHELVLGRILDAFGAEMSAAGFTDLTLAMVAKRAGIARATIYNYFSDKFEVLLAYVERSVTDFMARVAREVAERSTAGERLETLIRTQISAFADEPGFGSSAGVLDGASLSPEVFDALMGRLSSLHAMMREVLAYGVERGEFRRLDDLQGTVEMIGAVIGSQRMPVGEGRRSVAEATAQVVPFVLAALAD